MYGRPAIKDRHLEQRLFTARVVVAVLGLAVLMMLLVGRLFYLQVFSYEHFKTLSTNNRVRLVPIPPPRGLIYDRNGVLLAENLPTYSLEVTPEQVPNMKDTLKRLAKIVKLTPEDIQDFNDARKQSRSFQSIPLRFDLSPEEVARFAVDRYRFPGVDIEARLKRYYPMGGTAVFAIGYVGRIDEAELRKVDADNYTGTSHIGKTGIEKFYETQLHGRVGYQKVEINAQGRVVRVLDRTPPVPGENLYLTLDVRLQRVAEEALKKEGFNGAVVAIDPRSGEVLALASEPTYNPNLFVNGISSKEYHALRTDKNRPLYNRALAGQYPPGSTIKPFMALAGLHYGVVTPGYTMMTHGYYTLPGDPRKYRDWKRGGHGLVDLDKAITESVDVYFYDLAYHLGIDRIYDFLTQFGFGRDTGIDEPGELSGLLPSREWKRRTKHMPWFPGETVITGIGQGYMLTTPLQLASGAATIAMKGQRFVPHLLHAVQNPMSHKTVTVTPTPEKPVTLRHQSYWRDVITAMEHVTDHTNGTAYWHVGLGSRFLIAGKTGTAQVFGLKEDEKYDAKKIVRRLRDHSLFIAFAPANDPRIAVAVIAENAGHGSTVAAPIARKVMDAWLLDLDPVPPSDLRPPLKYHPPPKPKPAVQEAAQDGGTATDPATPAAEPATPTPAPASPPNPEASDNGQ
ncbi:MAG: penicillin-binding protein 2 [Gammaproteobacteria bacterium]|jgi:penicillin-binding protein 2